MLLDKKPIVCDMRWVDWEYIRKNEEHYPGAYDSFNACGVADFVGQKLTKWNDELIMQFYSTAHFYPDGRIVWMSEGTRYQSTIEEWANLINAPKDKEMTWMSMPRRRWITTQWHICTKRSQMLLLRHTSLDQYITFCQACQQSTGSSRTLSCQSQVITR